MVKKIANDEIEISSPYVLLKPIEFEGSMITEIVYDFDKLCGRDVLQAAKAVGMSGDIGSQALAIQSPAIQTRLVAKAADVPIEMIESLKLPDYSELLARVVVYFNGQG